MITIIMKRYGKQVEVDMPAMYEELQLALWKLGLDREPEKYTLAELNASFRFQMPFESIILRLLEGTMTLLDAIAAIFSFIAPPHAIRDKIHLTTFAAKSYSEAQVEKVRLIESSAQFESHCYYPIHGWLVGLDGDMKKADDQLMLAKAEVIGDAVQKMQKWIYGFFSLSRRIGSTIANSGSVLLIAAIGYDTSLTAAGMAQSAATIQGIKLMVVGFPCLAALGSFCCFTFLWNINSDVRAKMAEWKAAKAAK